MIDSEDINVYKIIWIHRPPLCLDSLKPFERHGVLRNCKNWHDSHNQTQELLPLVLWIFPLLRNNLRCPDIHKRPVSPTQLNTQLGELHFFLLGRKESGVRVPAHDGKDFFLRDVKCFSLQPPRIEVTFYISFLFWRQIHLHCWIGVDEHTVYLSGDSTNINYLSTCCSRYFT